MRIIQGGEGKQVVAFESSRSGRAALRCWLAAELAYTQPALIEWLALIERLELSGLEPLKAT